MIYLDTILSIFIGILFYCCFVVLWGFYIDTHNEIPEKNMYSSSAVNIFAFSLIFIPAFFGYYLEQEYKLSYGHSLVFFYVFCSVTLMLALALCACKHLSYNKKFQDVDFITCAISALPLFLIQIIIFLDRKIESIKHNELSFCLIILLTLSINAIQISASSHVGQYVCSKIDKVWHLSPKYHDQYYYED